MYLPHLLQRVPTLPGAVPSRYRSPVSQEITAAFSWAPIASSDRHGRCVAVLTGICNTAQEVQIAMRIAIAFKLSGVYPQDQDGPDVSLVQLLTNVPAKESLCMGQAPW